MTWLVTYQVLLTSVSGADAAAAAASVTPASFVSSVGSSLIAMGVDRASTALLFGVSSELPEASSTCIRWPQVCSPATSLRCMRVHSNPKHVGVVGFTRIMLQRPRISLACRAPCRLRHAVHILRCVGFAKSRPKPSLKTKAFSRTKRVLTSVGHETSLNRPTASHDSAGVDQLRGL
ncbi:unnamed protein product [Symbiodinium natans]|uniref:Secreted protein n=1 Tax=Symbiodinium natans TaxID=878477 RepID=A0A812G3L9_9DINO|nr:unnamed protein product [Symbiodinium natans]